MNHAEALASYLGRFVDELVAGGLEDVCLCPGSRSTPLALMFARHRAIKLWTHLDERSCAYFALGMAKARPDRPVAILCSSGTAAVNFAPAVVEAYHAHVSLLVLTADRPPELQSLGANQTIDQANLYGPATKWSAGLPLPEASEEALRYVRMTAARALTTMTTAPRGPVHLNFPFREPLTPASYEPRVLAISESSRPSSTVTLGRDGFEWLVEALSQSDRGVIICGPDSEPCYAVAALAERLGFPVLADPLSGVRSSPHWNDNVLGAHDAFLRDETLARRLAPDLILRFGDPPTSKAVATFMAMHRGARQVQVALPGCWPDPDLTADRLVYAPPAVLCIELRSKIAPRIAGSWLEAWREAERRSIGLITRLVEAENGITEPGAAYYLAGLVPPGGTIFAGNSMPVRDLDSFYPAGTKQALFQGNRGASGIDGVISSALGAAAVNEGRTILLIGDLSFYHDMNGLLAARRHGITATIVLINNDGGGIFSFLPQHGDTEHFEALFGTPHGLDFRPVAELYGLAWSEAATAAEYRTALEASFQNKGVSIVQIKTDREQNLALHRRIWREVAAAVKDISLEARADSTSPSASKLSDRVSSKSLPASNPARPEPVEGRARP